jgi:uncharacterized protein (DUF3084 family)
MSSGFVLILAILVVGGVIATIGDRLGSRVGKARLSLFNLRPRRTATLVTILTGIVVAASTLGILLGASSSLRKGLFELGSIEGRLRRTRAELNDAREEKDRIEDALEKAKVDREKAQKQLGETNRSLQIAVTERQEALAARTKAQAETSRTQKQLEQTQIQSRQILRQIQQFRSEMMQLQNERDRIIAQRDQEIQARDQVIRQREVRLKELESQQELLAREILKLEKEAQGLRLGNVAIQRGQPLASAVVRVGNPKMARGVIDQLLQNANLAATQMVRPGSNGGQIIQITQQEVERLINQIANGKDYVVMIVAASNYLLGETPIQVFAGAVPNQLVFKPGEVVASITLDPSSTNPAQIKQRLDLLIEAATFRARSLGVLNSSVDLGRIQDVVVFMEQLQKYDEPVELRAVASDVTYTAGPLKLEFIATQKGSVLFRSKPAS